MADVLMSMADAARQAPSIHNSQPWRFVLSGHRMEVLSDKHRRTPAIDPTGRGMLLACGAAALNALVTARSLGRMCTIAVGSQRSRLDLVAVLSLGGRIDARPDDLELAEAVQRRHTVREAFEDKAVPPCLVDRMRAAVEHEGAWMHVVNRTEDIVDLAVMTERAEAAEMADELYRVELTAWLRRPGDNADDGIPLTALPADGATSIPLRNFRGLAADPGHDEPPAVERPLLVIIGTDGDHHTDWIRAGMAMQRLWLTATAAGLGASPLTQALDHPASRAMLSQLVGLDNGHPQMLLRVGYCQAEALTGRRPLSDVLVSG
jgi:Nitroreductase family